ncbi:MAG: OmpH family outer membrane protein [Verrucomicrobiota bacterium]|nr:OmpH family outer membrane protein [Verrucomicrobiota bacterium]
MNKHLFKRSLAAFTLLSSALVADAGLGIVNFASCITDSKVGKKEQENMESIRKQMASLIEETEKEIKELSAKFEDTEFLDSLSPKAEEEMKLKYQTLQEDLGRYQNQFYQVLQHAQYQLIQKMSGNIAKASETIAKEKNLDYVINKEACFYMRPDLDVTNAVIAEMDKTFESESKKMKKLSDNSEEAGENNAVDENSVDKAG